MGVVGGKLLVEYLSVTILPLTTLLKRKVVVKAFFHVYKNMK
jgi:hypothetical protein